MGKVIEFPRKMDEDMNNVLFLRTYIKSHIIDLTKERVALQKAFRELELLKRRLTLKLISNESDANGT